jgi:defect-in-organelle-trafficking protein DotB
MEIKHFPEEPPSVWTIKDFDRLLLWARTQDASDIALVSRVRVRIRVYGRWRTVSSGKMDTITGLVPILFGITSSADSWTRVAGMEPLDPRYDVVDPDYSWKRYRFRVNATACVDGRDTGLSLVMRAIPTTPPTIEELGVEPALVAALTPQNGLVILTGRMGSGKSTLLAGVVHQLMADEDRHIISFEAPPEFDLMELNDKYEERGSFVVQAEIGRHLRTFRDAPVNSTRRAPDVVIYGEARDAEQMGGMIEQGEIGTLVYSTAHTYSVAATPSRIINVFPEAERDAMRTGFFSALRVIVQQRLLETPEGKRVAAREWLVFDESMRSHLMSTAPGDLHEAVEQMVQRYGQPLLKTVEALWREKRITDAAYEAIATEKRGGTVETLEDVA